MRQIERKQTSMDTARGREDREMQPSDLQDTELSCGKDAEYARLIEDVVRRYHHPLHLYATHLLGSAEGAQDIVQDTWVALYMQVQRQSPSWVRRAHLFAWLRTVVRNKALNYIKAQQRFRFLDAYEGALPFPAAEMPESSVVCADIYRSLHQAIRSLRQTQRDVIVYRFFYGYSLPEIINILGLPLNTVKARLARGKKRLQHALSERGVERSDLAALVPKHALPHSPGKICIVAGW